MMEICFMIRDLTERAGLERVQINLANALVARGNKISIWSCYRRNSSPCFELSRDIEVSYGRRKPLPFFLQHPWLMFALEYPLLMFPFALFVIRRRPQWIVVTDTNRLVAALLGALVPGVRLAVWEHFPLSVRMTMARERMIRRLAGVLATRIVTLTDRDTELYVKHYAASGKVTSIPNIVMLPTREKTVRRQEVLAVGRLSHQKGFDLLLEAWFVASRRLPGWSLRIVGEGPLRDQLIRQATELEIDSGVLFDPFTRDPYPFYLECGIFVLSSRWEGLPTVLIEAMICGTACISFDCPNGPRELIQDGVNGILLPPERVDALAEAIVKLGSDSMLRQTLGREAGRVSEQVSESSVAARWQELFAARTTPSCQERDTLFEAKGTHR
jgi:glycosyltransferase involved in cell wall biosynthesis